MKERKNISDQTCPKTGRYSIKKLFTPPSFFLKCYLGFSGSIPSCELDMVTIPGGEKNQATNKNMKRGENIKSNMCRKRKTKRLKKCGYHCKL